MTLTKIPTTDGSISYSAQTTLSGTVITISLIKGLMSGRLDTVLIETKSAVPFTPRDYWSAHIPSNTHTTSRMDWKDMLVIMKEFEKVAGKKVLMEYVD